MGFGRACAEKIKGLPEPVFDGAGGNAENLAYFANGKMLIIMKVNQFARFIIECVHQAKKAGRKVALGEAFEWVRFGRRERLPPCRRLRLRRIGFAAPVHIDVMGNRVKPGREAGSPVVIRHGGPDLEESLFCEVLRIFRRAETREVSINPLVKESDQPGSSFDIALTGAPAKPWNLFAHTILLSIQLVVFGGQGGQKYFSPG
jgi:hypothetical protein